MASNASAFERWKSLRHHVLEPQLQDEWDALPQSVRDQVGPVIRQYFEVADRVVDIRKHLHETSRFQLSPSDELPPVETIGIDPETDASVDLRKLGDHLTSQRALFRAIDTSDGAAIKVLPALLHPYDEKITTHLTEVIKKWENERAALKTQLTELHFLLEACENHRQKQSRLREEFDMGGAWIGGWKFADKGGMANQPTLWLRQGPDGRINDVSCLPRYHHIANTSSAMRNQRHIPDTRTMGSKTPPFLV